MSKSINHFSFLGRLLEFVKALDWGMVASGVWGVAILAAGLTLAGGNAQAQSSAIITGTVKDSTDALVPGAKVLLTNELSRAQWKTTSNGAGFFSFVDIPPAKYSLSIRLPGFESWGITGIVAHPGDNLTIPKIALKVGKASISIVVTAEAAGVTLNSGEHSTMITSAEISRLSTISRDVTELVNILPGFNVDSGSNLQNGGAGDIYGYQTTSPGGSEIGAFSANGSAPGSGQLNITSDGANVIDPGAMNAQDININMAQVQEVKVQTADFSAVESKGPIVIDAVGKSGGSDFHGSLYTYVKNAALNSNDWLSKYYGDPRPTFDYFYPGGTLGGPVLIPHTNFNKKKHLVFWVGFEKYEQKQPSALATAFIPSAGMMNGDLSWASLASALNVTPAALQTNCAEDYSTTALYSNVGGICTQATGLDQTGTEISNGQVQNIDPATTTISNLWPKANRTPQPVITAGATQYATDGINYTQNVESTSNGFQIHSRVDESVTDSTHLYGVYNLEDVSVESPMNNIYYNPNMTVPYPTPEYSNGRSQTLTLDLTKTFGPSLTDEFMASGVYYNQPQQFADPAKAQTTGTTWGAAGYSGGYLHLAQTQIPQIVDYEDVGIPSLAFGYVPKSSEFLRKFDWNVKDNVTKVYKTHTFVAGFYAEETGNNQVTLGSQENGLLSFMRWDSCYPNQSPNQVPAPTEPSVETNLGNEVGNFLIGCPLGYSQANEDPVNNLRYVTIEGYLNDDWKVTSRLTLNLGVRFSHLQPWSDAHGIGLAVWEPEKLGVSQNVLYPDTASNLTWPGISWHQRDSSIPMAGVPTRALFYQPRVGVSYDLYGNGRTTLRGGWGMYYSHDSTAIAGSAQSTAIGMETYSNPSSISCTFGQLFTSEYVPCGAYSTEPHTITPFSIGAMDPTDNRMPLTYNYNFTVDQVVRWNSVFEVAYVGNKSTNLSSVGSPDGANVANQNVIPLGAFFKPDPITGQLNSISDIINEYDYTPYPNYETVNVTNHIGWSNYNALQVSWNKTSGSLIWGVNYTWSKSLGTRGADGGADYNAGDPVDLQHDYGYLAFDLRQALNLTYSWQEGVKYHGNHFLGQVLNNWEISGINKLTTGPDLSILNSSTDYSLSGGVGYGNVSIPINAAAWLGTSSYALQPEVTCNPTGHLRKDQFVNGNCFALPPMGSEGWWKMPFAHGPAYFSADLTLFKDFVIHKQQKLQFQLSGFNFLNHPLVSFSNENLEVLDLIYGDACTTCKYTTATQALGNASLLNASSFGATSYKDGVRIVELGLQYTF